MSKKKPAKPRPLARIINETLKPKEPPPRRGPYENADAAYETVRGVRTRSVVETNKTYGEWGW